MDRDDELDYEGEAASELAELTDDELEAELTIAATNPGLSGRYEALLAERDRRHSA